MSDNTGDTMTLIADGQQHTFPVSDIRHLEVDFERNALVIDTKHLVYTTIYDNLIDLMHAIRTVQFAQDNEP